MSDLNSVASLYALMGELSSTSQKLMNKAEYGLQISLAKITERSKKMDKFKIIFFDEYAQKDAVLFYHPKFYVMNGYPKDGESVIVMHNNGNNAHILFSANPKDTYKVPYNSDYSAMSIFWSSAKKP